MAIENLMFLSTKSAAAAPGGTAICLGFRRAESRWIHPVATRGPSDRSPPCPNDVGTQTCCEGGLGGGLTYYW